MVDILSAKFGCRTYLSWSSLYLSRFSPSGSQFLSYWVSGYSTLCPYHRLSSRNFSVFLFTIHTSSNSSYPPGSLALLFLRIQTSRIWWFRPFPSSVAFRCLLVASGRVFFHSERPKCLCFEMPKSLCSALCHAPTGKGEFYVTPLGGVKISRVSLIYNWHPRCIDTIILPVQYH